MKKSLVIIISTLLINSICSQRVYSIEPDNQLWDKFLEYDLCITDYNALTEEEQELCHFIFDTEQSSDETIICERARRTLAHDSDIGNRITLEQLEDCYGICDMYSEMFFGAEDYIHCVPDIKHLDGYDDYNEYWLDDSGTVKVYSTGENSGLKEKTTFTVDIMSVEDISSYADAKNLIITEQNNGTYQITYEIERKTPNPRYYDFDISTKDDKNIYYDFTSLDGKDGMIVYNDDLYRITDDYQAIFLKSRYAIFSLTDYATPPITEKIVIPSEVNGYPVTAIGRQAFINSRITSIELPETLTRIDPYAFTECTHLTDINYPASLRYIGGCAFMDSGVTTIDIDVHDLMISREAFSGCNNLKSAHINAKIIGEKSFAYCNSLNEVYFGSNTEIIGSDSFWGCGSLEKVDLSESVCRIGTGAFGNRKTAESGLKSITISPTIEVIGALPKQHGIGATSGVDVKANHPLTDEQECVFDSDCVIKGYKGTEAERYANEWGLEFEALEAETGDVNLDGDITVADAVALQRFLLGKYVGTGAYYGDMNGDNEVDVFDMVLIRRRLIGSSDI